MLTVELIKKNKKEIQEMLSEKGETFNLDHLIKVDEEYQESLKQLEVLNKKRTELAKFETDYMTEISKALDKHILVQKKLVDTLLYERDYLLLLCQKLIR